MIIFGQNQRQNWKHRIFEKNADSMKPLKLQI